MAITTVPSATAQPGGLGSIRPAGPRPMSRRQRRVRDSLTGYAFLIGAVFCFALFSWYPMIRGIVMSFQHTRRGVTTWVGWDNYVRIVHDPSFWTAWKNTLYFTVLALLLGYLVPFFVAILFNELRHAKGYLRILVYLPVMLPPASALFLFKYYAYDPSDAGLFNAILRALHLPTSQWMQSPTMTMPAMVIASTWMN
ncbi:MAG TPA: sugar ABC transporter permease, partial [Actinoplanes sp.]|nr:sugar ABC transporter permease [Actinoplanes sp.]